MMHDYITKLERIYKLSEKIHFGLGLSISSCIIILLERMIRVEIVGAILIVIGMFIVTTNMILLGRLK